MTLSLDPVVSVSISISPQGPNARGFGIGAIFGTSAVLPLNDRMRVYGGLDEVFTDFVETTPEYLAAQAFFMQEPTPESVKIGRIFTAAQSGTLRGGTVSDDYTDYTSITDGGFDVVINGTNRTIADLDFSGAASMAAIATLVQTKLNAALAGTTCAWATDHFLITAPTPGATSTIGYAVAATTGGPSADISTVLGLTSVSGAQTTQGIAIESITSGLAAAKLADADFFGFTLTSFATVQNIKDAAAWAETNDCMFAYTTNDANAKDSGSEADLGFFFDDLGYKNTIGQYSTTNPYAGVSLLSRMLLVDFDQPNSTITLKFKKEPGVSAEPLTSSEAAALKAKHLNYYVDRGGFTMIEEGVVANGRFIDEVHGIAWLQATLQLAAFTELATATTKIPQTDAGVARLVHAIERDGFEKAVRNGLIAPGFWLGEKVGEKDTGAFLEKGYYLYALPVGLQDSTSRAAREAPPLTGVCIGAGAIHSVNLAVTFQR